MIVSSPGPQLANQMLEDLGGVSTFTDAASASSECSSLEGASAGLEAVAAAELSGAAGNGGRQGNLRACDVSCMGFAALQG